VSLLQLGVFVLLCKERLTTRISVVKLLLQGGGAAALLLAA
jgi:hypothetical protein